MMGIKHAVMGLRNHEGKVWGKGLHKEKLE